MLATVAKILGSVIRSLFISIVMLIIALSVITGQFPPDIDRLKNTYSSLQEMATLSREIHEQKKSMDLEQNEVGSVDMEDIRKLEELNVKRAELGANLLPHGPSPKKASTHEERHENSGGGNLGGKTQAELESKIRDLQQELFRLQERVNRMESRQKEKEGT